ncbi:hypothetical protein LCL89_05590 [Halobacillus yeomjeoni]|uniref:hypothetical protein n=1 Tax=Halobacillus yeomjeoni TaxID=311194 RepID=UPI001CD3814D|nr:hypothetical protein [Halobacillus yeomjeoni]MCA0983525.1 hypothetical protein [Halobacillus yeomjeoni]
MSEYLIEHITRCIVQSLPEQQRALYKYVVDREDLLADKVTTPGEFMSLLETDQTYQKAADHFGMTWLELLQSLKKIEEHIADGLERMVNEVSWTDCTHLINKEGQQLFYVDFPRINHPTS